MSRRRLGDDRFPVGAGPAGGGDGGRPGVPRVHGLRHRLRRGAPPPLPRGAQHRLPTRRRRRVPPRLLRLRRPEVDEEEEDEDTGELEIPGNGCLGGSSSVLRSGHERFDDDYALFEDSMSLKILGISDACLATLSSQDNDFSASPKMPDRNLIVKVLMRAKRL